MEGGRERGSPDSYIEGSGFFIALSELSGKDKLTVTGVKELRHSRKMAGADRAREGAVSSM